MHYLSSLLVWGKVVVVTSGQVCIICLFSVSSTRFSLPSSQCSSSIQRCPSTRSRTNRVQHIQGGCSTSPHPSLWRVSILSHSVLFFLFGISFSLFVIQWQVLILCAQSQRSGACQPRLTITHSPTSTACWINQQACSKTCAFAQTHGKWLSIWPCTVVSLSEGVFIVEWEVLHFVSTSRVYPAAIKRKTKQKAISQP